jgi:G:T-mismatch repair DNA endonuclease (very short patch repair protein)
MTSPHLVNNRADLDSLIAKLNDQDLLQYAQNNRPNTKYAVEAVPATSIYVYKIKDFPIGCCMEIPAHITDNKAIFTLQHDSNNKPYDDNLCFFRCLAVVRGSPATDNTKTTRKLFKQWRTYKKMRKTTFPGVTLKDRELLEKCFNINVDVFYFDKNQILTPKIRGSNTYKDTLQLLHYENHFLYISDIDRVAKAFACSKCGKLWKSYKRMTRHEKTCTGNHQKDVYKGGMYRPQDNIWETIASYGISVDTSFVFPYRATFDFECYFEKSNLPADAAATKYLAKHIPLSCSVASNVPKFEEPVCFVSEGDAQDLVSRMARRLEAISDAAYAILLEKFEWVFKQLNELGEDVAPGLIEKLDAYLKELPTLSFNGGKYDLNLIKPYLIHYFIEAAEQSGKGKPFKFVVKKNNDFMCIATEKLKLLDVLNYLAPGNSYKKYIASYKIKETKGVFCYEYVDSLEKLKDTALPPPQAFFSSLKNCHVSAEDYAICQQAWVDNEMTTLKDLLVWYNNLDVGPFLLALEQQVQFYANLGVDMFKDAISVPGVTLRYLFKTLPKNVSFSLCSKMEAEFHETIRKNIVGGPSIIFHRYHEAGKTKIRGGKDVQSVKGFDANALYLWALMEKMPTDFPITRRKENAFKAVKINRFVQQSREWLTWTSHVKRVDLRTQYNGKEMSLGKRHIRVDGWDCESKTAYQFHGCLFHGHPNCPLTKNREVNPVNGKTLAELYEKTREIRQYLTEEVKVSVVVMWECQWRGLKKTDPEINIFLAQALARAQPSYEKYPRPSEQQILDSIKDETLFGLVECDISVPERLKEKFSEMTPIFKNIEVGREDISPLMREYADKNKLLTTPRRTLIGSYKGEKILLATPLLKWYIDNELEVTNIYRVVEYNPVACFKQFGDKVSEARRQGDIDEIYSITGETMKLLGNSAYGKCLSNKAKHADVVFCRGDDTSKMINAPLFKKMAQLSDDLFEVEMLKKKTLWDLPNQIGFFVYQYAKLRMLEFYYDFLDKFVDRSDFELCEMDTDSLYLALSTPSLKEAIRPHLRQQFYKVYDQWFPSEACDNHRNDFINSNGSVKVDCAECRNRNLYDKRTPGLFKFEFQGSAMIALCSKTYICFGSYDKTSAKGLSKTHNKLTKDKYARVLDTKQSGGGTNKSFKTMPTGVYTYEQHRNSLSFFYIKRRVLDDNVTTVPLSI